MSTPEHAARVTDPTARTLALLSLLQTHRHWKGAELAGELGVSERTVRRDIERLRGLGYPVDAGPGVDGGYRLGAGAHLPPLLLDDDEVVALILGVRANALASIEGIDDTSVRLMAKLDQMLPDRVRRRVDALHGSIEVLSWSPSTETIAASTLVVLGQGCRDHEEVRFDYRRRDGEESTRLVQPLQLVSVGRRWYMVAWDVRRDDWRTFRVDRIDTRHSLAHVSNLAVSPPIDAATFVAQGLRTMTVEHRATVDVAAPRADLDGVVKWFDAGVDDLDDTTTRLHLRAESLEWLASMITILSVSHDIDVVDAPDLVCDLIATSATRLGATRRS